MYFVLLDSTGNLLASYRDEDEARAMLHQLAADDPDASDEIALMTYDDEGEMAADPVFLSPTVSVAISGESHSEWYSSVLEPEWETGKRTEGRSADLAEA